MLNYHEVLPAPERPIGTRTDDFAAQMHLLVASGFTAISTRDLADFVCEGAELPERPILISFDDGTRSQLDHAIPVLRECGFTATFFAVKECVESGAAEWMSPEQLRALAHEGFDIEAHGTSHGRLVPLAGEGADEFAERVRREVDPSWLRAITGRPVTAFAYPYGLHHDGTIESVAEAGYRIAFATRAGDNFRGVPCRFMLRRWSIERSTRLASFASILTHVPAG